MHPALELERPHDLRHLRVIAVVADAHGDLVLKVNALDLLQKTVHKVLARLFAVANHVQAQVFLGFDPEQGGVRLGFNQGGAFGLPLRPELLGFGQPGGFGQAASDRGGESGGEHGACLRFFWGDVRAGLCQRWVSKGAPGTPERTIKGCPRSRACRFLRHCGEGWRRRLSHGNTHWAWRGPAKTACLCNAFPCRRAW